MPDETITSDIEHRAKFDYVRYAQLWEDADILTQGLSPKSGSTVVSIASAGDNALALLTADCERVIAIDLNPTQLACVRIRKACYQNLSYSQYLELFGARPSTDRAALLEQVVKYLDDDDLAFWKSQTNNVIETGLGGIGKFENYFRFFSQKILPLVHSQKVIDDLLLDKPDVERAEFYNKTWNNWRWRIMLKVFFSKFVMGRLGRDPAFFDHAQGSLAEQVSGLTHRALVDQNPHENPYLHWILKGTHGQALPLALREEHFETIRTRLDRLEIRLGSLESLINDGIKVDAFNLSDIFEYMSPDAFETSYGMILDMANSGAKLAYWNMMVPRQCPSIHKSRIIRHESQANALHKIDKAFFYKAFHLEEVI